MEDRYKERDEKLRKDLRGVGNKYLTRSVHIQMNLINSANTMENLFLIILFL